MSTTETTTLKFGDETIVYEGNPHVVTYAFTCRFDNGDGSADLRQTLILTVDAGAKAPQAFRKHQFLAIAYVSHLLSTMPRGTSPDQALHLAMAGVAQAFEHRAGVKAAVINAADLAPPHGTTH
jgi:hypothetical protein